MTCVFRAKTWPDLISGHVEICVMTYKTSFTVFVFHFFEQFEELRDGFHPLTFATLLLQGVRFSQNPVAATLLAFQHQEAP